MIPRKRFLACLLAAVMTSVTQPMPGAAQDADSRALLQALSRGNAADVNRLLAKGAAVEPMHMGIAVLGRHPEMARLLVEHGADPDVMSMGPGAPLESTVGLLAATGKADALRMLLDLGADPDYRIKATGPTPLMAALLAGKLETARLLVERGADPALANGKGETASDFAVAAAALTGNQDFVDVLGAGASPEARAAMDKLRSGLDIDGTHQAGASTLSADRETYPRGRFSGPCLSRRNPLMDPAHPNPGDVGSGSYRETHVWFEGGMKVGAITPPGCAPLDLAPARYRVTVVGAEVSWVWRCRDEASTCLIVQRDDSVAPANEEFHITVMESDQAPGEPDDTLMSPLRPRPPERTPSGSSCRVDGVRIVAPARGAVYEAAAAGGGLLRDLVAQAEVLGDACGHAWDWHIDDVAGVTATQRSQGRNVTFTFSGLPATADTVTARITVRLGTAADTLSVRVVLPPRNDDGRR